MANSVETDQTALKEKSGQGLHYLIRDRNFLLRHNLSQYVIVHGIGETMLTYISIKG